jgi:type 1 glutamine amidotransferase
MKISPFLMGFLPVMCLQLPADLMAETQAQAPVSKVAKSSTVSKTSAPPPIPLDINGFKTIIAAPVKPSPVKVAIFQGPGAPESSAQNVVRVVKLIPGATARILNAEEVGSLDLTLFDAVVFPGGSASQQAKAIGEVGRAKVKDYVKKGGGYVGICAGAYLACTNFDWSLGIMNASTVSRKWMRGSGYVDLEVTHEGRPILGEVNEIFKVRYNNGPIIKPSARADLPSYRTLSFFRTEVAKNGAPEGIMVDSPAQAISTYGKGRVFISSPHPENTPGLEHLIPRGILWAAGELKEEAAVQPVP